jgi:dCMP deaminase
MSRPDWNSYFLEIAKVVSKRGTCSRKQVGCVLVDVDHQIVASGYNGAPAGLRHCNHSATSFNYYVDANDLVMNDLVMYGWEHVPAKTEPINPGDTENGHCTRAQHAERNAIAYAAKRGIKVDGATAYLTLAPCLDCARLLVTAGVKKVVWSENYSHDLNPIVGLFVEANVSWQGKYF